MKLKLSTLLVTLSLASMGATAGPPVTDQMIENDAKSTGDVLSWGIGQEGQRYCGAGPNQRGTFVSHGCTSTTGHGERFD
mgnify:CR=1 FL=1